jgi:uncharacterized protein YdeI (YjbR/CyaY-like superfamily)
MRDYKKITITSRDQWRQWLVEHHTQTESIWLVRYKKESTRPHVAYIDVVQEALCFGWIDSLPRKLDEQRSMLLLSPRRVGSAWSAVNKSHVAAMIKAGLMTSAGLAKIEHAKANGRWDALNEVDAGVVPDDLLAALVRVKGAKANFEAFSPSSRRGILEWISNARTEPTRNKRISETARLAGLNLKANHPESRGK